MKINHGALLVSFLTLATLSRMFLADTRNARADAPGLESFARRMMPVPPKLEYSVLKTGPLEVAKVFGRLPGCASADSELVFETARAAFRAGLDPRIAAATVAVESGCNPFAVSSRGAIGLMQVVPKVWKQDYDFSNRYNLLNSSDNIEVGTRILAGLIQRYGVREGVKRYQGLGEGCASCDAGYADKILKLAGRN